MLVLSRKEGERLVIDGRIIVQVVRIEGGKVRLGIEAPADVHIQREELRLRDARRAEQGMLICSEC